MKIGLRQKQFLFLNVGSVSLLLPIFFFAIIIPTSARAEVSISSFATSTLIALTNKDRTAHSVGAVTDDKLLDAAAQKKADDMAAGSYFSHYSPQGVSPWHWFSAVGYYYSHAAENLALNIDDPESLENAWMASPLHRANILRGLYTKVGIGISYGTYWGKPAVFIVEFFATPAESVKPITRTLTSKTHPA